MINNIDLVIVHDGLFHADDVLVVSIVKRYVKKDITALRTRNVDANSMKSLDILVADVGGEYDPHLLNFDHHQNKLLPSACELLFNFLFREGIIPKAQFDGLIAFVETISRFDTGMHDIHADMALFNKSRGIYVHGVNAMIRGFNRVGDGPEVQDKQFFAAVAVMDQVLDNLIHIVDETTKMQEAFEQRVELSRDAIFVEAFTTVWKSSRYTYAVMPAPQGWMVQSKNAKGFPLHHICKEGLVFLHPAGFMAVYKTKMQAVNAAAVL